MADDKPGSVLRIVLQNKRSLPGWDNVSSDEIVVKPLHGGLTNVLFRCHAESADGRPVPVVVRLFGNAADAFFDRKLENRISVLLSEAGWGARIYCGFTSTDEHGAGRIEQFLDGHTLRSHHLPEPDISRKIVHKMAALHSLDLPLQRGQPLLVQQLPGGWTGGAESTTPLARTLTEEVKFLTHEFTKNSSQHKVVFCHNDLQEGNIIYDEAKGHLHVIDYEYAGYNYRGFDIGNHFCEFGLDYHAASYPFFTADASKLPDKAQRHAFLSQYLAGIMRIPVSSVTIGDVETVDREALWGMLSSHLMWALWAVLQSVSSEVEFGYLEYAIARMTLYHRLKPDVVSLKPRL